MKKTLFSFCLSLCFLSAVTLISSCASSKKVVYFQDVVPGETAIDVATVAPIRIQPEDRLSIIVTTRDEQLADLFNLSKGGGQGVSNTNFLNYTVDSQGFIDFPILGKLKVQNMKREEVATYIKQELINRNLLKDPVVTVNLQNLYVSVMGEVGSPGRINIDKDRITLLDALTAAGDLTIQGNRTKVMVMRQEGNKQRAYAVDLTSGKDIYTSPVYYLQQNDLVYVEPIPMKARQADVNGNMLHTPGFWMSVVSFLSTFAVLIFK